MTFERWVALGLLKIDVTLSFVPVAVVEQGAETFSEWQSKMKTKCTNKKIENHDKQLNWLQYM